MCDDNNIQTKIFNDPIHGHIELDPLCIKIIDTPQFQRLRYIKQLGACYFVFPGACHNRFEHSLGVGFLAGELVRNLQLRQGADLNITREDILCVQIAGLCHDLGHGPFSHMFDNRFIPLMGKHDWKHEIASMVMFDHLVEENNLLAEFKKHGLNEVDLTFIKEQIGGHVTTDNDWPYKGRGKEKSFLYEVVANKRNGIDVDKWDYFARDCHHLGIRSIFDHYRFMKFARVIEVDGQLQICSRDKEVGNLYDMFHTRNALHRRAYQHKNSVVIEIMITEALRIANEHLLFPGKDGTMYKLSESINDMHAYTQVHDGVYHMIRYSNKKDLQEARDLLDKIEKRQLYKCIGQTRPASKETKLQKNKEEFEMCKGIASCCRTSSANSTLEESDFVVDIGGYDYGLKEKNPVDNVRFYLKGNPKQAMCVRKDEVSHMLPDTFSEQYVRVYFKKRDEENLKIARAGFKLYCKEKGFVEPKGGDPGATELTPMKNTGPGKRAFAEISGVGVNGEPAQGDVDEHNKSPPHKSARDLFKNFKEPNQE